MGEILSGYPEVRTMVERADYILPVPLSEKRLGQRGYNQVYLIARALAVSSGFSTGMILKKEVRRIRPTDYQKDLDFRNRRKNIKGAFAVVKRGIFEKANILILDDIFTTGSTVRELSKEVKKSGAETINVLVIAR